MTTGRINQITRVSRAKGPPGCDPRGSTPPVHPRRGQSVHQEGTHGAPDRRAGPGVPGTTRAAIQLPPLSPSAPVRTQFGPSPRYGGRGGGRSLRHTALGRRDRAPWSRRQTADTTGRLPPGIFVSGVASGHPSTDPISAGHHTVPGLRPPRRHTPSQSRGKETGRHVRRVRTFGC